MAAAERLRSAVRDVRGRSAGAPGGAAPAAHDRVTAPPRPRREPRWPPGLLPLVGFGLVAGAYFVLRYDGRWAESDSAAMTQAIRSLIDTGHLDTGLTTAYSNGFGYQAVSAMIIAFTGLDPRVLQQLVYPLISALVMIPAWVLYRELTGSGRTAGLATLLLILVPEYLFSISRASHERLDRAFLFAAVWLLVRSLRQRADPARFAVHLALTLVFVYSLVATNALFGMSFVLALSTALTLAWIARRFVPTVRDAAADTGRLLGWTTAAAIVLTGMVTLLVYPPILDSIRALSVIPGALADIIVNGGSSADPYKSVSAAWVSTGAFLLLSTANFVLLGASVLVWFWIGLGWLRGGAAPTIGMWMLWVLFAAFAFQGAIGIVSDRTGALQGNAQYRAFPVFATMAAPMVAQALVRLRVRLLQRALVGVVAFATAAAFVKATLDPIAANRWLFFTDPELQAMGWVDLHQRGATWVGQDDRLQAAYLMMVGPPRRGNVWDDFQAKPTTHTFLLSDPIRLLAQRQQTALPSADADVLYDNGAVVIVRTR